LVAMAQARFWVETELAGEIGDDEEKVADLVGQTGCVPGRKFVPKFLNFFLELGQDLLGVRPVEADTGGPGGKLQGTAQGGQGGRPPRQRPRLPPSGAFGGFLRFPGGGLRRGASGCSLTKHMRMTT